MKGGKVTNFLLFGGAFFGAAATITIVRQRRDESMSLQTAKVQHQQHLEKGLGVLFGVSGMAMGKYYLSYITGSSIYYTMGSFSTCHVLIFLL